MQRITEQVAALIEERNALAQDGYILGYITASHPGSRPNFTQYHLREYGQKVGKYISKKRLPETRSLMARGQQIKDLDEAIAKLQKSLDEGSVASRRTRSNERTYKAPANELDFEPGESVQNPAG